MSKKEPWREFEIGTFLSVKNEPWNGLILSAKFTGAENLLVVGVQEQLKITACQTEGSRQLLFGLYGAYLEVSPLWQEILVNQDFSSVYFDLLSKREGDLVLRLDVRLPKSMTLLRMYEIPIKSVEK